ncbi:hypothetical protein ANO11243_096600 [Dothideomycetidae sp. 11243]|nr:hypothetical protein ANO11243_096600 [fungal sp. No.11243]
MTMIPPPPPRPLSYHTSAGRRPRGLAAAATAAAMTSARYSYTTVTPSDRLSSSPTLKRPYSSISADPVSSSSQIFTSTPIHDRKSTFTGLFSPSLPPLDLQTQASISSASHKILAYRLAPSAPLSSISKKQRQSTLTANAPHQTGQDDDGEQYAAKHVARVLHEEGVTGSLVVARWYGGVMLGPVRFAHIAQVARGAVQAWRASLVPGGKRLGSSVAGGTKVEQGRDLEGDEEVEKETLTKELQRRDESITALRTLLADKKVALAALDGSSVPPLSEPLPPVAAKQIDYASMSVERLRVLDQARDGTIAFLLKQIDGVEAEIHRCEDMFDDDDDEGEDLKDGDKDGPHEDE